MAQSTARIPVVRAAGVVPWRLRRGRLEVALVHRAAYDDWSWAKGKLDRGEDWAVAAVRETFEETGMRVRLGLPLPGAEYPVGAGIKQVRYWAGTRIGGHGLLEHEIDDIRWLTPAKARKLLTYPRDRDQVEAVVTAYEAGRLDTWPLLVVRHAKAVGRGSWSEEDPLRPLDESGRRRSARMVPLLGAYAPTLLVSSPSLRCHDTMAPFAVTSGTPILTRVGLSEEGYAARPEKLARHLERVLTTGEPTALCTHGPLLPELLTRLAERAEAKPAARTLRRLALANLDKGEVVVASMAGTGADARVVAVDRHRPPRS